MQYCVHVVKRRIEHAPVTSIRIQKWPVAQAPLPLPISLASHIIAAAPFFKRPLVTGSLVSRRRAKGL